MCNLYSMTTTTEAIQRLVQEWEDAMRNIPPLHAIYPDYTAPVIKHRESDRVGGHSVGRLQNVPYFYGLPENEYSLAQALRDGGYQTWHVGKWHLGDQRLWPEQHGFDVNVGGCAIGAPRTYFSPYNIPTLPDGPEGEYLTDRLTDEAINLVERAGDQPFLLNFWHYGVNTPMQAPADLVEKYERKAAAMGLDTNAIEQGEPMPAWHLPALMCSAERCNRTQSMPQ